MTNEDKKMIPLSVIDAKMNWLDIYEYGHTNSWQEVAFTKRILNEIKKEAIPSPEKPMHEQDKSVQEQGLEQKINETIKDFKAIAKYDPLEDPITKYVINVVIPTLEKLLE